MKQFVAIDFETGNPKRVSACALGYAVVSEGNVVESNGFLIKPIGGHAPFQSKIHGIKDEHTRDKPYFDGVYPSIKHLFEYPLVGHSMFDKQVLQALSDHFSLNLSFDYTDSCAVAKERFPGLKNHKLPTLTKHFNLPSFKHHDASEDAMACANIFMCLQCQGQEASDLDMANDLSEFRGLAKGILADDEVNYKEAYELLYWLDDHSVVASQYRALHLRTKEVLEDDFLDHLEAQEIRVLLKKALSTV